MEIQYLLLYQLIAHLFADYFFQGQKMSDDKNALGFRSKYLIGHIFIVFITSWILSFQIEFFVVAGIIAICHFVIDGLKPNINNRPILGRYSFFIDQGLHLLVLIFAIYLFDNNFGWRPLFEIPLSFNHQVLIACYLICLKPANIVIKEIFRVSQIEVSSDNEMPNAGKLIGILERLLALTFIIIGQFQAVGFLLAAKSVLRYKDTETLKMEYVLIGTMLSFGVAVILGVWVTSL